METIENSQNEIEKMCSSPIIEDIGQDNIGDLLNKSLEENYKLYSPPPKPFIQEIGREKELE